MKDDIDTKEEAAQLLLDPQQTIIEGPRKDPQDFRSNTYVEKGVKNKEGSNGKMVPTTFLGIHGDMEGEGKLGHRFMSVDELQEIDLGDGDKPWPTCIRKILSQKFKGELTMMLKE